MRLAYFVNALGAEVLFGFDGEVGGVLGSASRDQYYLNFSTRSLFGFGVAFLTPVLLMVLERAGIVTRE